MSYQAPLAELFERSKLMLLDFSQLSGQTPQNENIQLFFEDCEAKGLNPRLPEYRQQFNEQMLRTTGARYLVSRYGEDRKAMLVGSQIAAEGRTLHMGIDIFCKDQEPVYAPCNGTIIRTGYEQQAHGYGHYLILQPTDANFYFFFGHLAKQLPPKGPVSAGERIATIGNWENNENGGWSRHLHLEIITELPAAGETPVGYSSRANFAALSQKILDPMPFFPGWVVK